MSARLDAVTKAKQAYVMAKTSLEARLREQMRSELSNLQTQVDIAVRYAFDDGESKADILRAMGTKDYHTLNSSLERTSAVKEVVGVDPLDSVYQLIAEDVLEVTYSNHGPSEYTGTAVFDVKRLDDGGVLFLARDPLWTNDYKTRNDVVAVLDGMRDGYYYEEASAWTLGKFSGS
jgi:hypothetical protein